MLLGVGAAGLLSTILLKELKMHSKTSDVYRMKDARTSSGKDNDEEGGEKDVSKESGPNVDGRASYVDKHIPSTTPVLLVE